MPKMIDHTFVNRKLLQSLSQAVQYEIPFDDILYIPAAEQNAPKIVLSALIHGNEILGHHVLLSLLQRLVDRRAPLPYSLCFIWGNSAAYKKNQRFIEKDLNRSFLLENPKIAEETRASIIEEAAKGASLVLDLHQTTSACETPFFLFPFDQTAYHLAKFIDPNIPIMTYRNAALHTEGASFARFSQTNSIPHITLEMGEKGLDTQLLKSFSEKIWDLIQIPVKQLKQFAEQNPPLSDTVWTVEKAIDKKQGAYLVEGLKNFTILGQNQTIYTDQNREVKGQADQAILFPKYGEYREHSNELCRILKKISVKELLAL
jgi:succinylglutamate desuccinylase